MFNLTYEFKLKPTQNQIAIFEEWIETHRRVGAMRFCKVGEKGAIAEEQY